MQAALPDVAVQLATATETALSRAGGVRLARIAEADPAVRLEVCKLLMGRLGVDELDARSSPESTMAAGMVCRMAGRVAFPYPVVSMLARTASGQKLAVVGPSSSWVDHGDILDDCVIVDMEGSARRLVSASQPPLARLGPFVVSVARGDATNASTEVDVAVWMILNAWWVLGSCERAAVLTAEYVMAREQFGGPLARLQSVRLKVADMRVAVRGLEELARYTTVRCHKHAKDALTDALAVRVVAQECARLVFRTAHQLHGAIGFTDEYDLSVLHRHAQPYLRLPLDYEATSERLASLINTRGFQGLYGRFSPSDQR